eukprot:Lankesteria_metandrocarpae@DN3018_c1_g1_i1.p1
MYVRLKVVQPRNKIVRAREKGAKFRFLDDVAPDSMRAIINSSADRIFMEILWDVTLKERESTVEDPRLAVDNGRGCCSMPALTFVGNLCVIRYKSRTLSISSDTLVSGGYRLEVLPRSELAKNTYASDSARSMAGDMAKGAVLVVEAAADFFIALCGG